MNLSNAVTLLRLASVPFFAQALALGDVRLAAGLFWFAVASDLVDGRLARARGESSRAGALLDHGSDALFVVVGLAVLAGAGRVPIVLPALVALAFFQYVLDSRWLEGRPLRASMLGRWNGILYFVPLGAVTTRDAIGLREPSDLLVGALAWGLVGSTLASMIDRAFALFRRRSELPEQEV